jgi:thioredoxin reductase (NADPH)
MDPMTHDVVIVGGGPAGLASAIAATRRNLNYLVLEQGALVNSLLHFPTDMVFFTTPELLEIGGLPFVTPYAKPTRAESLRYYQRVTDTFGLEIAMHEPVTGLVREPDGRFLVTSQPVHAPERTRHARAVVIATGAYDLANELCVPGERLPHVSHFFREPYPYYRHRVVVVGGKNSAAEAALELYRSVVGGKNSAAEAALELYRSGARVLLVHRREALGESIKYWVKPDIENRIKEGTIQARFSTRVVEITPTEVVLDGPDGIVREPADAVLLLTGYRSDTSLFRKVGAAINEVEGAPVYDGQTFETTVPNLFMAGAVIAGRQSGRIFIENGRFHGEVVIAEIARRLQG